MQKKAAQTELENNVTPDDLLILFLKNGSGALHYCSELEKHKGPPTCRSMSMSYEYVVVFTTAENILFSALEPRPGRARTSAKMHHAAARPPLTACSLCLQEASEGISPYIRPVKSHSSYLCFLRFTVSTQQHCSSSHGRRREIS